MSRRGSRPSTVDFTLRCVILGLAMSAATPARAEDQAMPAVGWQEAIDRALARNPSAVVARQEIARADALVTEARAGWLPQLSGNGLYLRRDSARVANGNVVSLREQWNGNLQLVLPLLSPQAWTATWHAQDARQVTTVNAAEVRRQLAASVGRAYLTVLLQHRQLEVAVRAQDTARAHYDYAHTRLQGGLGNAIDDARAEQELRGDESQVGAVQAALVRAQSALAILMSEDHLVDARADVDLAAVPAPERAVDDARKNRTDVRAYEARLQAARHLSRDDWAYYAPSLQAVAQAFVQTETPLQAPRGWVAQLVLSIPLYDGGYRYGVGRERKALEEESRVQWEASLRQVSVEVRTAFEALRRADESLAAARASARAADTAARLADLAYRAGATTNLELIDAERRARDAASLAALAEDSSRQARLDLLLASGRFP
jgi:outer membrane protein TolC